MSLMLSLLHGQSEPSFRCSTNTYLPFISFLGSPQSVFSKDFEEREEGNMSENEASDADLELSLSLGTGSFTSSTRVVHKESSGRNAAQICPGGHTSPSDRASMQQFLEPDPEGHMVEGGISSNPSYQPMNYLVQKEEAWKVQSQAERHAQKLQEARKRRKNLIEERKMKKARREEHRLFLVDKNNSPNSCVPQGIACSPDSNSTFKYNAKTETTEAIFAISDLSQKYSMDTDRSTSQMVASTPFQPAASAYTLSYAAFPFPGLSLPYSLPSQMGLSPPYIFPLAPTSYGPTIPWFYETQTTVAPCASWPSSNDGSLEKHPGISTEMQASDVETSVVSKTNSEERPSSPPLQEHLPAIQSTKVHTGLSNRKPQTAFRQYRIAHTVSESGAEVDLHKRVSKPAQAAQRDGSRDQIVSEIDAGLGKAPNQEPAKEGTTMREEDEISMANSKGSSTSQRNTGDLISSEVCSRSEGDAGSLTDEETVITQACNISYPSLRITGDCRGTQTFPICSSVFATGPAPNGKTVTGTMYILNKNQVKIICTCHAMQLSASEFVEHAGHTDLLHPEKKILVSPFPCTP